MAGEKGRVEAPGSCRDFVEQAMEAVITGRRKPLHLVFVGPCVEPQELGYGAIQPGKRIRILPFFFELQMISLPLPARATAEVAGVIECEHGGSFKRRREKGGRRVRQVMLHHGDFSFGEQLT